MFVCKFKDWKLLYRTTVSVFFFTPDCLTLKCLLMKNCPQCRRKPSGWWKQSSRLLKEVEPDSQTKLFILLEKIWPSHLVNKYRIQASLEVDTVSVYTSGCSEADFSIKFRLKQRTEERSKGQWHEISHSPKRKITVERTLHCFRDIHI